MTRPPIGSTITLFPQAKVNLSLVVLGRRPDGYHTLETLFERLDLADELRLTLSSSGVALTCDTPDIPTDGRNLVVRAVETFFAVTGIQAGVTAVLTKRIPVAGGLGGGSSDAASTLLGLNALCGHPLSPGALLELGRQLGADVPFFVSGAVVAWGRGLGDEIEPLSPPETPFWHVLVNPGVPVLTAVVYGAYDRLAATSTLTPSTTDAKLLARLVQTEGPVQLAAVLRNALEPAIIASYPAIRDLKAALSKAGARGVTVSGSGPTTYGLALDEGDARGIQSQLQRFHPTWRVLIARTAHPTSLHPVLGVRGDEPHARLPK